MTPHAPAVDAVVFDLGGVLIEWDPRALYRKLLPDEAAVERFLTEVDFAAWNHERDAGRPFDEGIAEHAHHPHHHALLTAYRERFPETLIGPVEGTVDVLAALRSRPVRLLALTNWSAETFPHARERFAFLSWFEAIMVSGEERLAKPDPRLYRRLIERFALDPARAVYIDDNPANVQAAAAVGLRAVRFLDAESLRAHLVGAGVLEAGPAWSR